MFSTFLRLATLLALLLPAAIFLASGCASLWTGATMKQVEKARTYSLAHTVPAPLRICAQGVIDAAQANQMLLFVDDMPRQRLMLLHVPECNDTTEVGIFFTPVSPTETKVEISSLSNTARDKAAAILFPALEKTFAGSGPLYPTERIHTTP